MSNDTLSKMSSLSKPSSLDDLPIIDLLDKPFHEMSDEEKEAFAQALRSARINTTILVNRIEKEASEPKVAKSPAKPKLDLSDLIP